MPTSNLHDPTNPVSLELLPETEVSEILGISTGTLQNWRVRRFGPPYVKVGRLVRYTRESIVHFCASRTVGATDKANRQSNAI